MGPVLSFGDTIGFSLKTVRAWSIVFLRIFFNSASSIPIMRAIFARLSGRVKLMRSHSNARRIVNSSAQNSSVEIVACLYPKSSKLNSAGR